MSNNCRSLPSIGFCGLGAMGGGMARCLLRKGFTVTGYDVHTPLVESFVGEGGTGAATPKETAQSSDILFLMVTSHAQVTSVLLDTENGAIFDLKRNAVVIISSTVPPHYCQQLLHKLNEEFKRGDIYVLDCPVSGGTYRAADGTLSIFSSGHDKGLAIAQPVLESLSSHLYTVPGSIGFGSKAKMCHQVLPEVDIALAAEVMALAARAGLNTQSVFDAVQMSGGASWIIGNRVPHMLQNDWSIYSVIPNSFKDSSIILQAAELVSFPTFLVSTAQQVYQAGIYSGWAKDDDSTLHRLYLRDYPSDIIHRQTKVIEENPASGINVADIIDIFIGGHLAASAEALGLIEAVGLDTNLMYDIVKEGAAANAQFVENFPRMIGHTPHLTAIDSAREVGQNLGNAIRKANAIGAPLPVASAALQLFHLQLGHLLD